MPEITTVNPTVILKPTPKYAACTLQPVPKQLNMLISSQTAPSRDSDTCPYSVLGLRPGASSKQIRRAHKRRMRIALSDETLRGRLNSARDKALHISSTQVVLPWCCLAPDQAACCPCVVNAEPDTTPKPHINRELRDILALTGFGEFVYLYPQSDYDMCDEDD